MNLTRRIFASLIPAAPVAAAAQRSGLGSTLGDEVRAPTPHPQDVNWINKKAQEIVYPSNWNQFREAERKLQDVERYRRDYHEFCRYRQLDPNIESLKSVSRQHKIHMQIKQERGKLWIKETEKRTLFLTLSTL